MEVSRYFSSSESREGAIRPKTALYRAEPSSPQVLYTILESRFDGHGVDCGHAH